MIENMIMITSGRGQKQVRHPFCSLSFICSLTSSNNPMFNLFNMFLVIICLPLTEYELHKSRIFFSVLFMKCLKYLGEFPGPSKWTININELSLLCARHYAENWCWGTKKKKRTIFFTEFTVWCSPGRLGRVMGLSGSPCPQHLQFASCDVGQREWDWNGAHLNFSLDSALRRSPNHLESHFLLLKNHCEDLMH